MNVYFIYVYSCIYQNAFYINIDRLITLKVSLLRIKKT